MILHDRNHTFDFRSPFRPGTGFHVSLANPDLMAKRSTSAKPFP